MPSGEPTLLDAMETVVDGKLAALHVCLPGKVERYDPSSQKADVKPMLKKRLLDGTVEELPIIPNVPVVWPRTADFAMAAPISRGDQVLLLFAERSLDEWLSEGGTPAPADRRKFDLSDAVAIPGLYSFKQPSPVDHGENAVIQFKGSAVTMKKNGDIRMEGGSGKVYLVGSLVAAGSDGGSVNALINSTFKPFYDAHTHTAPGGTTGPPLVIPPATVETTVLKGQ